MMQNILLWLKGQVDIKSRQEILNKLDSDIASTQGQP